MYPSRVKPIAPILWNDSVQDELLKTAIETNQTFAARFGINPAAAITCVKPSGTAAKLVGSSSGIHVRWADYYIQRIRVNTTDPLLQLMRSYGVPCLPEVGQDPANATTWVLEFPMKSPKGALTRHDVSAMKQLETWLRSKQHWCEHNPSCTVYVKDDEWISVLDWVDKHWDLIGGLSFFPSDNSVYPLAPYEEISKDRYDDLMLGFPVDIDYDLLQQYEQEDNTTGARELACAGGQCEI